MQTTARRRRPLPKRRARSLRGKARSPSRAPNRPFTPGPRRRRAITACRRMALLLHWRLGKYHRGFLHVKRDKERVHAKFRTAARPAQIISEPCAVSHKGEHRHNSSASGSGETPSKGCSRGGKGSRITGFLQPPLPRSQKGWRQPAGHRLRPKKKILFVCRCLPTHDKMARPKKFYYPIHLSIIFL